MKTMTIIKTKDPQSLDNCKIVTRPSGDNPWYLVCVNEIPSGLEEDVVDDTAEFLSQFDLGSEDELDNVL